MSSGKRLFADFKVFSVGYLRNKFGLFFGLIFPVVLILIFGAIFSGGSTGTTTVYVQNQDNGPFAVPQQDVASQFLQALNQSNTITVVTVNATGDFAEYLADHSVSDGIVIPANFSADYIAGNQVNVTVYGNPSSSTSGIVSGTVNGYANYFNLRRYNGTNVIGLESATVNTQQTKYIDFLIPGLIGFSILTSPMFSLVNISSDYKKNKLFKQLSLTPLTKQDWSFIKRFGGLGETRIRDHMFGGGIIADGKEAMLFLGEDKPTLVIWSNHIGLVGFAREYFQFLWDSSASF
jgi:ABC-2 type transport system permease protein